MQPNLLVEINAIIQCKRFEPGELAPLLGDQPCTLLGQHSRVGPGGRGQGEQVPGCEIPGCECGKAGPATRR